MLHANDFSLILPSAPGSEKCLPNWSVNQPCVGVPEYVVWSVKTGGVMYTEFLILFTLT